MKRRIILSLAAVLAIGACSDQQEPSPETSAPDSEFSDVSGAKPVNVVTKAPAPAAQLAELAQYGTVVKEIRAIKAVMMAGDESSLSAIKKLRFVAAANFDAERNIPPFPQVQLTDFTGG